MKVTKILKIDKRFSKMTKNLEKAKWKWFNLYLIRWINLWIHWWFSQKIQIIKMGDIFRKFVNILNESVDKFNWICGWIQMNSLMNSNQFIDEFKSICWWIQINLLMKSNQFVDEFKWIC
jgi:hypothetical protein